MGIQDSGLPQVNEIAYFLHNWAPDVVAALNSRGERYQALTQLGVLGGAKRTDLAATRPSMLVRADILAAGLDSAILKASQTEKRLARKIALVRRCRLASTLLTALGSSGIVGVVTVLQGSTKQTATIWMAIITFLANGFGALANDLILGHGTREHDIIRAQQSLMKISAFAELTRQTLPRLVSGDADLADLRTVLKEGNQYFADLTQLLTLTSV